MQCGMLLLAFLAAAAVPAASAMSMQEGKALVARVWLRAHDANPNGDELAELKDANPEAYAIVKALLTKRSLGLLDPHHPTASFARSAAPAESDDVPRGPAVFAKFATKTELAKMNTQVVDADAYPEVTQPVSHSNRDWLNWKPAQSAMDDDAMVKNVLGSVAEAMPKPQLRRSLLGQTRGEVSQDAPAPVFAAPPVVEAAAPVAPAAPANAASEGGNDYLDSIGGFGDADAKPKPSLIKQNSHEDSNNYLASFSWDDSKKQTSAHSESSSSSAASSLMADAADLLPEATTAAPARSASPAKSGTALMKWLR